MDDADAENEQVAAEERAWLATELAQLGLDGARVASSMDGTPYHEIALADVLHGYREASASLDARGASAPPSSSTARVRVRLHTRTRKALDACVHHVRANIASRLNFRCSPSVPPAVCEALYSDCVLGSEEDGLSGVSCSFGDSFSERASLMRTDARWWAMVHVPGALLDDAQASRWFVVTDLTHAHAHPHWRGTLVRIAPARLQELAATSTSSPDLRSETETVTTGPDSYGVGAYPWTVRVTRERGKERARILLRPSRNDNWHVDVLMNKPRVFVTAFACFKRAHLARTAALESLAHARAEGNDAAARTLASAEGYYYACVLTKMERMDDILPRYMEDLVHACADDWTEAEEFVRSVVQPWTQIVRVLHTQHTAL